MSPAQTALNEIQTTTSEVQTPWYLLRSPELGKPFHEFYEACTEISVLDRKTKELLMAVLASVFRSPRCTEEHIKAALEAGASKEELTEALLIAAAVSAATQLAWQKDLFKKYLT